ncbi:sugar MFS transporter [Emticicia sp. C21]|uniref:sugar MFS transporter n=1 Tax=Emticicia sp. C21 TaxID=2302915 RepID=UPI000E344072|nr:sugar MFS transporter [Emticicia sp. C21]RFS17380.1 glucose/galactose MFS transporter [Emticicia sp. C21]
MSSKKSYVTSVIILATLFFIFGFISWSNAILIPYFKIAFELTSFKAYLVAFAFYISYLVISLPSSILLNKFGYKRSIVTGLWVMALGALIFIPAAMIKSYGLFLTGLFTLGTGLSILQTASNPYITIIGPIESAAQRISIMGICNKGAGIIAPLILSFIILKPTDIKVIENLSVENQVARQELLSQLLDRVILPYGVIALALFMLGTLIYFSSLPEIEHEKDEQTGNKSILSYPNLILGAIAIFFHVGTQVIAVDTIINYGVFQGLSLNVAKVFPSYVLTMTITGYITGIILIPRFVNQHTTLKICTILGLLFSISIIFTNGGVEFMGVSTDISIWFIVLLGLANSLIWAGIWPLAIKGLGNLTKVGSSLMIMGLSGNAIMPLVYGYFADKSSPQSAYWILIPCFLYLIFYTFYGYSLKHWKLKTH